MKELRIIESIRKRAGNPSGALKVGIGDDSAVLEYGKDSYLLWCQDMLVEGTHFRRSDGLEKAGRKSVAVNISDIAAMGGDPLYISVSAGLPAGLSSSSVRKLHDGILGICSEYGIRLAGGDTVRCDKIVIDVSMLGRARKSRLVKRSGAKPGDAILITGPVRDGKKEHLTFRPRINESRFLSRNYLPSSMIDTSDGIAPDLGKICMESGTGCRLFGDDIPLSEGLSLDDALYYGESFELLFTMSKRAAGQILRDRRTRGKCRFFIIGEITDAGLGMKISGRGAKTTLFKKSLFEHF